MNARSGSIAALEVDPQGSKDLASPRGDVRLELLRGPSSLGVAAHPGLPTVNQRAYLAGGELRSWNGPYEEVVSPISIEGLTGTTHPVIGFYPKQNRVEAISVLAEASKAYAGGLGEWPMMPIVERLACVDEFIRRMQEKREEIVSLIVWEVAKTRADAEREFDRTIEYLRATIVAADDVYRRSKTPVPGTSQIVERSPRGVTLCMGPFNYPLNETLTTVIPALVMGNTVIVKPPKQGVLLFEPLLEAFKESFPPGVINTIYGDGAEVVGPLMESGKIDCLAFIGSAKVAEILINQHPLKRRLHTVLGLGAKNPAIVLADADIDNAVKEGVAGALSFNGQRCTAIKTFYVHSSIAEKFSNAMAKAVERLKIGLPWESGVSLTPLAEPGKVGWMNEYVADAELKGAKVINRGGGTSNDTLYTPAVLYPVRANMKIYSEEQFGPIVPIVPFENLDEVIAAIRDSNVGQQASIFTEDREQYQRVAKLLNNLVSRVHLNAQCKRGPDSVPFTGRKDSGKGILSERDALEEFSVPFVRDL